MPSRDLTWLAGCRVETPEVNQMRKLTLTLMLVLAGLLAACGGGSTGTSGTSAAPSSDLTSPSSEASPSTDASPSEASPSAS